MDKHIGRAEIRLKNLEGMPDIFTSYYEVLEKKLSIGATSQVSRKTLMTSGVGAIQAQIAYQYINTQQTNSSTSDLSSEMNWLIDQQKLALEVDQQKLSDQQLIDEFNKHLKSQRDNHDIEFKKIEEEYPDDSDNESETTNISRRDSKQQPLSLSITRALSEDLIKTKQRSTESEQNNNTNTIFETVSSFFGYSSTTKTPTVSTSTSSATTSTTTTDTPKKSKTLEYNYLPTEDDSLKSFPILDTIGSWTMGKETNQVLRAIGKLLVAYVSSYEHRIHSLFC